MDFYLICSVKTTPATGFFYIIYSVKTNIFKYPWNTRLGNALGDVQGDPEGTSLVLLGPASLLTAELLVIQGPFNGELCWEWFFFFLGCNGSSRTSPFSPDGLRNWSGRAALAAHSRTFWGCWMGSRCVQEAKKGFFHWLLSGGHCLGLDKS